MLYNRYSLIERTLLKFKFAEPNPEWKEGCDEDKVPKLKIFEWAKERIAGFDEKAFFDRHGDS